MRVTLVISLLMHLAILFAAIVVLPAPEEFKVTPQEALPVEIVSSIEDDSKRVAMRKETQKPPKAVKKPAPPKVEKPKPVERPAPKPAREVSQPKPAPKPEPEPAPKAEPAPPAPDPADLKKLVEKVSGPEPAPKARAEPKPAPARPVVRPRARPKIIRKLAALHHKKPKKDKAIDDIAALLNKVDDKRSAPPPPAEETGTPQKGPADMNGEDARLAATLVDKLRQKIESCWNIPAGVEDAQNLRVRIRFQMSGEGLVTGGPEVLNHMSHPAFNAAAQSAVRAVLACQPYDFLPIEKYDLWKDVILNFDPGRMLATN